MCVRCADEELDDRLYCMGKMFDKRMNMLISKYCRLKLASSCFSYLTSAGHASPSPHINPQGVVLASAT